VAACSTQACSAEPSLDTGRWGPSRELATLMISTLEGAIMWARVHRDVESLDTGVTAFSPLLDAQLASPDPERGG
jgi:hypothetical protein